MNETYITAAAIATVMSGLVAAIVSILINRSNSKRLLHQQLNDLLKISIEYPYLENPVFTKTWNKNKKSEDDNYLRYENYCTIIFNYMESYCKFHYYNDKKISKHINIKGWIRTHKDCWKNPSISSDNTEGYSKKFRNLMDSYLK
jgi:hypothetical protein